MSESKEAARSRPKFHEGKKEECGLEQEDNDDLILLTRSPDHAEEREAAEKKEKVVAAHGLALDFGRTDDKPATLTEDKISVQLESPIAVVFELPDGSILEETFKLGQTVIFLKSFLDREASIPMGVQALYYEEKMMLDPLCLADYLGGAGAITEMYIRVDGEMEDDAKK